MIKYAILLITYISPAIAWGAHVYVFFCQHELGLANAQRAPLCASLDSDGPKYYLIEPPEEDPENVRFFMDLRRQLTETINTSRKTKIESEMKYEVVHLRPQSQTSLVQAILAAEPQAPELQASGRWQKTILSLKVRSIDSPHPAGYVPFCRMSLTDSIASAAADRAREIHESAKKIPEAANELDMPDEVRELLRHLEGR